MVDGGRGGLTGDVPGPPSQSPARLHVVHGVGKVSVVRGPGLASSSVLEGGTLELHVSSLSE